MVERLLIILTQLINAIIVTNFLMQQIKQRFINDEFVLITNALIIIKIT